ncbi:MAG: stage II sporulation protein M [Cocleimonas sp.]|nr:stage II sporulation protein M [Cocleimonas sp.]
MKQSQFVDKYQQQWQDFEHYLDYHDLSRRQRQQHDKKDKPLKPLDLPHVYRQICHHYALANSRCYNPFLIKRLNHLVTRGHQRLYGAHRPFWGDIKQFIAAGFPALIRKEWRLLMLSSALFYVPFFAMIIAIQINSDLVYSVMEGEQIRQMESMYNPESFTHKLGREREADSDLYMFGFYIKNNTGIGFRNFAGGLLFGLGTLFFLFFNGLMIGAAAGHLTALGFIDTFWGFVLGHGAFELTAIVLSGVAGLKLAEALIRPQRKSRLRALVDNGKIAVKIMYGAAAMFIIAAFIEAFWSSMVMPVMIKYVVAALLWSLVIAYFWFLGRNQSISQAYYAA